ncbi:MAG: hypothetical protein GTO18_02005 [Anaerolineales bacterium]|nr:hypothetical protein [Anaerolineales bacterium]
MNRLRTSIVLCLALLLVGCSVVESQFLPQAGEGNDGTIKLPPAWTPTPVSNPVGGGIQGSWQPCEEGPPSQLELGRQATIAEGMSASIRLRSEAGFNGNPLGMIEPGDVVEIVDGPVCSDLMVWWHVQSLVSDASGWTAERNAYSLFLQRID